MLTHIVLFRLKDRSQQAAVELQNVLLDMKGKIPQLLDIEVGVDVLHSERSYDVALITKFNSLEDMQAYQVHPVHVEVGKYVKTITDGPSVCVDFES